MIFLNLQLQEFEKKTIIWFGSHHGKGSGKAAISTKWQNKESFGYQET